MYLRYVRNLGFTETPDYQYLIDLFDKGILFYLYIMLFFLKKKKVSKYKVF